MTTSLGTIPESPAQVTTEPASELRLAMTPLLGRGALDGVWWPRSRDIDVELADLLDNLPDAAGHVVHATFSRPDWDTAPRAVRRAKGRMKTGSYPGDDTHVVMLSTSTRILILMVVPSETLAEQAEAAMRLGSDPDNQQTAPEILAAAPKG